MSIPAKRSKMVHWYAPRQLMRTAGDVAISTIFAKHSDRRFLETLTPVAGAVPEFDYGTDDCRDRDDILIDYVADSGDGWDSTYTVACSVAHPNLDIKDIGNRRADILVFGGDQVYPVASRQAYKERLRGPYETALESTKPPHPHVFAIPGNHDWYDSLVSFMRFFAAKEWFAGWRCPQDRSYFALRLPHGWWLVGTDVGLEHDIDQEQVAYFKQIAAKVVQSKTDRVILCNAEPYWVTDREYRKKLSLKGARNLEFLERLFEDRIRVFIAGDLHHYRRHSNNERGVHKITAGGGGAFLHPTHGFSAKPLEDKFVLECSYPTRRRSWLLTLQNFGFIVKNPSFGLIPAALYVMTAWSAMTDPTNWQIWSQAVTDVLHKIATTPSAALWCSLVLLGTFFFTDTSSTLYRFVGGGMHAVAHLMACFFLGWGAGWYTINRLDIPYDNIYHTVIVGLIMFGGGWILGSLILGLYLLISVTVGRHRNEAFSALAIPDWKSYLRLHITRDGLTIYAIGIDKVPRDRDWEPTPQKTDSPGLIPKMSDRRHKPHIVDGPIKVV